MLTERHVFAGNNTANGFFSYFDYMFNPEEAKRIYILKGGPGVGKSFFMKKFGATMLEKGYSIEYIHCSSDNDSLDGIILPKLKVAFVDGTAPHTIDPRIPGASDEIINLGFYLNNKELEKHKSTIIEINKEKSVLYQSAYRYLESASLIMEEINSIYDRLTDNQKFILLSKETIRKILPEGLLSSNSNNPGSLMKLFSEAYTADGYINHTNTLYEHGKAWNVVGKNLNYISKLLDSIVSEAIERGFFVECYYRPLNPEKLQHILIPELNLMIKSTEKQSTRNYDEVINIDSVMDLEKLKTYNSEITNIQLLYDMLINNALDKLSETKKQHELVETIYISCMDFKGVDTCFENIMSQYI